MNPFYTPGWQNDPAEVARVVAALPAQQGCPARFADYLDSRADDGKTVLLWEPEIRLYGKLKPTWDQRAVGTCVSFGWGRGLNDIYLRMVAEGKSDEPPGDVATEPIYGFSRVEVGGRRLGRGDGSLGAWAAKGAQKYGNLFRTTYGTVNLSQYSENLSRDWGYNGVPDSLEPTARVQIAKSVAQVQTFNEAWQAIGSWYPVPVCSDQGFGDTLSDGVLAPQGNWAHCMLFRGKVVSKRRGRLLICQNSWPKNWIRGGDPVIEAADGTMIELPEGCFGVEERVADRMLRQDDSFSVSDVLGFPVRDEINWSNIFER